MDFNPPTEEQLLATLPEPAPKVFVESDLWAKTCKELTDEEIQTVLEDLKPDRSIKRYQGMSDRQVAYTVLQRRCQQQFLIEHRRAGGSLPDAPRIELHLDRPADNVSIVSHAVLDTLERPWERLRDSLGTWEPSNSYAAFLIYRDLGPTRTLAKTSRLFAGGHQYASIQKWSKTWLWDERTGPWDVELAEKMSDRVAAIKANIQYGMHQNLLKTTEIGARLLDNTLNEEDQLAAATFKDQILDIATRQYTALFGTKNEVKGSIGIALAHAILAEPQNVIL